MSVSYASINEVWGDSFGRRKSAAKKSIKQDPACGLYKRRDGRKEPLDDIMDTYMDDHPYDMYKCDPKSIVGEERERGRRRINIKANQSYYDVSSEADEERLNASSDKQKYRRNKVSDESMEYINEENKNTAASRHDGHHDVQGYYEPSLESAFNFEDYYGNEAKQTPMFDNNNTPSRCGGGDNGDNGGNDDDHELTAYEERMRPSSALPKEEIYKDLILEKYANLMNEGRRTTPSGYAELAMYVISGILLIFMMEQILQLGVNLR
jgi:hypothetical protein